MAVWMMALAAAAQAQAQTPGAEAEALGLRLARTGLLATLVPVLTAKDTEEMVAEQKALDPADIARWRATAAKVAAAERERLIAAAGHGYARALSVADLRVLVRFNESPAAQRWRRAEPAVIAATMAAVGKVDFKGEVRRAFCAETGKGCPGR